MIEVIKQFFGGSVSAVEAFVGSVSVISIITLCIAIIKIVYEGKKRNRDKQEIKQDCEEKINEFKTTYDEEFKIFKETMTNKINNLADMLLIEATKEGVNVEKFKEIVNIYKETSTALLTTDNLIEDKQKEEEQAQTNQEQVNENIKKIEELNGLV